MDDEISMGFFSHAWYHGRVVCLSGISFVSVPMCMHLRGQDSPVSLLVLHNTKNKHPVTLFPRSGGRHLDTTCEPSHQFSGERGSKVPTHVCFRIIGIIAGAARRTVQPTCGAFALISGPCGRGKGVRHE